MNEIQKVVKTHSDVARISVPEYRMYLVKIMTKRKKCQEVIIAEYWTAHSALLGNLSIDDVNDIFSTADKCIRTRKVIRGKRYTVKRLYPEASNNGCIALIKTFFNKLLRKMESTDTAGYNPLNCGYTPKETKGLPAAPRGFSGESK